MDLNVAEVNEFKEALIKARTLEIIDLLKDEIIHGVSPEYEEYLLHIISSIENLKKHKKKKESAITNSYNRQLPAFEKPNNLEKGGRL